MKKFLAVCCIFVFLFSLCGSAQAEKQKTRFDDFADGDVITIENGYYKEDRLANKIQKAGQKEMFQTVIKAWCNLLRYEVDQGAKVNDTMAAEIYRCFKSGYANGAFCAIGPDSELINCIFGVSSKKKNSIIGLYWLEWNTKTQVIRASKREFAAASAIKKDRDILDDPEFSRLAKPAYLDFLNLNPVQCWWDSRSDFVKFMDQLYSRANKGKKPGIK